jgi:hypothetical protein
MLGTAVWFDRQTVQSWLGAKVTATRYFLGLGPGTPGTIIGVFENAPERLLLVVEWEVKEQAARRLDFFSQTEVERYLQRVSSASEEAELWDTLHPSHRN